MKQSGNKLKEFDHLIFHYFSLSLSPSQRKCRLEYESEPLLASSVYSFNLCRSQCRFKMALKECGCIPYFYRSIGISTLSLCSFFKLLYNCFPQTRKVKSIKSVVLKACDVWVKLRVILFESITYELKS